MKIYKNGELIRSMPEDDIFAMANVRGKDIAVPHKLPFSFYFSERESSHAIRVKPIFNPNRVSNSKFGSLELHGNWKYTPGPDDGNVSQKQIGEMKQFFKKYKVLFAAVWESQLYDGAVVDYLKGNTSFHELINELYFYDDYKPELDKINSVEQLEQFVRENRIFNMWD